MSINAILTASLESRQEEEVGEPMSLAEADQLMDSLVVPGYGYTEAALATVDVARNRLAPLIVISQEDLSEPSQELLKIAATSALQPFGEDFVVATVGTDVSQEGLGSAVKKMATAAWELIMKLIDKLKLQMNKMFSAMGRYIKAFKGIIKKAQKLSNVDPIDATVSAPQLKSLTAHTSSNVSDELSDLKVTIQQQMGSKELSETTNAYLDAVDELLASAKKDNLSTDAFLNRLFDAGKDYESLLISKLLMKETRNPIDRAHQLTGATVYAANLPFNNVTFTYWEPVKSVSDIDLSYSNLGVIGYLSTKEAAVEDNPEVLPALGQADLVSMCNQSIDLLETMLKSNDSVRKLKRDMADLGKRHNKLTRDKEYQAMENGELGKHLTLAINDIQRAVRNRTTVDHTLGKGAMDVTRALYAYCLQSLANLGEVAK